MKNLLIGAIAGYVLANAFKKDAAPEKEKPESLPEGFVKQTESNEQAFTRLRENLLHWVNNLKDAKPTEVARFKQVLKVASLLELSAMNTYVFKHLVPNKKVTDPELYKRIQDIAKKYNIFG